MQNFDFCHFQKRFTSEIRFYTFNTKYGRFFTEAVTRAAGNSDAIHVFSAFIEIGGYNDAMENIIKSKFAMEHFSGQCLAVACTATDKL